ncbi:hypothetical protein [Massilia sp. METH4]|uniref:hypothetical protein n=1 Tax=Massilia sp. METH4 TaxID=3123041 RepID=UPI0030CFE598
MRLTLEFVPQRPSRWRWVPGIVTSLAALVLFAQYTVEREALDSKIAALAEEEKRVLRLQQEQEAADRETPEQAAERARLQAISDTLAYPWHRVFATLEGADMPGVALLSFSYAQSGEVGEVVVESADAQSIVDYVSALNGKENERPEWYLASLQPQRQGSAPTTKAIIRRFAPAR